MKQLSIENLNDKETFFNNQFFNISAKVHNLADKTIALALSVDITADAHVGVGIIFYGMFGVFFNEEDKIFNSPNHVKMVFVRNSVPALPLDKINEMIFAVIEEIEDTQKWYFEEYLKKI